MSRQRRVKHVTEAKRKVRKAKCMNLKVNKLFDAGLDFSSNTSGENALHRRERCLRRDKTVKE